MDEEEWPLNLKEVPVAGAGGGCGRRCGAAWWRRRVPCLRLLQAYGAGAALADAVAGATLGLTLVPQSIAYAALADLPAHYGLYSSFVGTIVYAALGTVREVSIGPTSLMALLTLQACAGLPPACAPLLAFLCGCVVLLMAALRLGFVVELIPPAVTSGFTSATAIIIVVSQLKGLLGLSFVADSVPANLAQLWARAADARLGDCALAALCCPVLLLLRKLKDLPVGAKRVRLRRALWVVSIARNALVVLASALLAYCTRDPARPDTHPYFKLSGRVQGGLPALALPGLGAPGGLTFAEMARSLAGSLLLLPAVMVLANIAIAKAYAGGGRVDASQEMTALGLCNVLGALAGAMPTCGAFTRSAVAVSSGVRSPLAGLYPGLITLLALMFLTEYFYYIPKATLSSVLICAVIFMVDIGTARRLWRVSRGELAVLALTLAAGVALSVELALLAGAAASLARLLRRLMRPPLALCVRQTRLGRAVVARGLSALVYANAEHVCGRLARAAAPAAAPLPATAPARPAPAPAAPAALLLDCAKLTELDLSAVEALTLLSKKLAEKEQKLVVFNASPYIARRLTRLSGAGDGGEGGVFPRACLAAAGVEQALAAAAGKPAAAAAAADDDNPCSKEPPV